VGFFQKGFTRGNRQRKKEEGGENVWDAELVAWLKDKKKKYQKKPV